jgi:hypothetical protein
MPVVTVAMKADCAIYPSLFERAVVVTEVASGIAEAIHPEYDRSEYQAVWKM